MRALVFANVDDDDAGFVAERLINRGFAISTVYRESLQTAASLDGIDVVVSLGSEWSVYWPSVGQSVAAEAQLIRNAHDAGIPVLGICFGAQLAAFALGGRVTRAPLPEIGWFDVDPTTAGDGVIDARPWFQWHNDRFEPPPGATILATSARSCQGFSVGRTIAVQFHPEVTAEIVERWISVGDADLVRNSVDAASMLGRTVTEVQSSRSGAHRLVDMVLDQA